ncbi:MAG: hypothetical protein LBP21_07280 [Synergistaceae bacterium]|jgi:hypothetical protein|nr:hypothetical protein [Synergistaceae bacterium]
MTWKGFAKGLLFCGGMFGGFAAGHLFYFERYTPGMAMFLLTALFLFYALADLTPADENEEEFLEIVAALQKSLAAVALVAAENAVNEAKSIGRTLPPTPAEIVKLKDDLLPLLSSLQVNYKERERLIEEIDKLKTRSRQNQGRRVLIDGKLHGG